MKDLELENVYIYLLERTERQLKRYKQLVFKKEGIDISDDQWIVLKRISEQETVNQREVAALTLKDPASITRIIDILEQKQLVVREPVENDRRSYQLQLTALGMEMVKKITPLAIQIRAQGLTGISETELEQLKQTLNKIYWNFQ